jgi:hypothetical protein
VKTTETSTPDAPLPVDGATPLAPSWDDPAATAHVEEVRVAEQPFVLFGIEEEGSNNIDPARLYTPDEARRVADLLQEAADASEENPTGQRQRPPVKIRDCLSVNTPRSMGPHVLVRHAPNSSHMIPLSRNQLRKMSRALSRAARLDYNHPVPDDFQDE